MVGFEEVWSVDTEWGFNAGRIDRESAWEPVVFCALGLLSQRRFHFLGRDPELSKFIHDHSSDLFVAHYAVAEMKYLLRLDISLPPHWFDTFVAWRYFSNSSSRVEASLLAALGHLKLPHLAPATKHELQQMILHLRFDPNSATDRSMIVDYCFNDCDGAAALYENLAPQIPPLTMTHWVEYLKAVARMELRGIPFDVSAYREVLASKPQIRAALIGDVNLTAQVYRDENFSKTAFLAWCRQAGITWPLTTSLKTGKSYHSVSAKTLKEMEGLHPFIAQVRQVQKTLSNFGQRALTVDEVTGRHYYGTSVFRAVTGRNQPREFVFNAPKGMRLLIVAEPQDQVLVYTDYVAQEIGLAAALSGDPVMRAIYEADDCHMAFAIRAGAAPAGATKRTHGAIRKQYKTVNLSLQYGQSTFGIAAKLGISRQQAESLVTAHKSLFPVFWDWSERTVQAAFDRRYITTPCGWRSRVPFNSKETTWMNWPMQAAGGDIMRLTITYLDRQNVRVLAPVHDGFLMSCRRDQLGDLRAALDYACGNAVEHVIPGFPLRWDSTVYENRFEDEDGLPLWNRLQDVLHAVQPTLTLST